MTRGQIEKAAVAIKESQNYHMSFEDAQDYISKCGFDIPWNDGDVFVDDREITRTIGNVLKWRINSVWHKKHAVIPDVGRLALLELIDPGSHKIVYKIDIYSGYEWRWLTHYEYSGLIRFAYIDDLLPERKEENNVQ